MPSQENEKLRFIREHSKEIAPITGDLPTLKEIDSSADFKAIPQAINSEKVENILEEFETKVFTAEKPESKPGAKRVLVEADNPGAYEAIRPLVAALLKDERCGAISAVMSGVAARSFEKDFSGFFSQIREKDKPVLVDIIDITERKPIDAVIATKSGNNAPDSVALFGSKSSLGAKKLFFVLEGWGQPLNRVLAENRKNMDAVDGVFCNDELAKKIILHDFPEFSSEKIYSFGTPIIDSLDIEHRDEYRKKCREKWGIDERAKVLLYGGCISSEAKDWYGSRDDIDERTFQDTFRKVVQLAEDNPDDKFVFAFRPHPRDDKKEDKYQLVKNVVLPPNLSFKDGGKPLSMNEAAYGADIILSIFSTENLLAPLRGRKSIFLGFGGSDMGRGIIDKLYGKETVKILSKESDNVRVADSSENLGVCLAELIDSNSSAVHSAQMSATQKIIDIIMAES